MKETGAFCALKPGAASRAACSALTRAKSASRSPRSLSTVRTASPYMEDGTTGSAGAGGAVIAGVITAGGEVIVPCVAVGGGRVVCANVLFVGVAGRSGTGAASGGVAVAPAAAAACVCDASSDCCCCSDMCANASCCCWDIRWKASCCCWDISAIMRCASAA